MAAPWGVTECPDCGDWSAELVNTEGHLLADPDSDGLLDVILYGAVCPCGGEAVQMVQLETA